MSKLIELLTRENITLALSIFGTIGTVITFIANFLVYRKNLRIKIVSSTYKKDFHQLILVTSFENRSRLPITVTSVSATINDKQLKPLRYPRCVGEFIKKDGNEIIARKFLYNLKFPIDIQPLSAVSGHILFDVSPKELETLSTPLTLSLHSTRGSVQKIEFLSDQIKWI